jgi:hypothetical protein
VSGQPVQRAWGLWAAGAYALAALAAAGWPQRGRTAALVIALAGAIAAPLAWQAALGPRLPRAGESSLTVVTRSAALLLRHGTPYLPADKISHALQYNPYGPVMSVFGLPAVAGVPGAAGDPRLWLGLMTAAVLAAAFRLAGSGGTLRRTAFAVSSPVLALPLMSGLTDLPVLALLCLALAGAAAYPRRPGALPVAAVALGVACAMKATAWPAGPVIAALLAAGPGGRVSVRFAVTAVSTAAALAVAAAPAAVAAPGALVQNTVLFPLGLTRWLTQAQSPLPGHLLAGLGPAGRWAAIALLAAASLALAASLIVRPPADLPAAAWRLAAGLTLLFALAPASRWGYFVYPAALLGFVRLTAGGQAARDGRPADAPARASAPRAGRRHAQQPRPRATAALSEEPA